jgi:hypothetical protein
VAHQTTAGGCDASAGAVALPRADGSRPRAAAAARLAVRATRRLGQGPPHVPWLDPRTTPASRRGAPHPRPHTHPQRAWRPWTLQRAWRPRPPPTPPQPTHPPHPPSPPSSLRAGPGPAR